MRAKKTGSWIPNLNTISEVENKVLEMVRVAHPLTSDNDSNISSNTLTEIDTIDEVTMSEPVPLMPQTKRQNFNPAEHLLKEQLKNLKRERIECDHLNCLKSLDALYSIVTKNPSLFYQGLINFISRGKERYYNKYIINRRQIVSVLESVLSDICKIRKLH